MRTTPNPRIPLGILLLILGLTIYGFIIAAFLPELIGAWPVLIQTLVYAVLGVAWLLPLKRFLIWMESGGDKTE